MGKKTYKNTKICQWFGLHWFEFSLVKHTIKSPVNLVWQIENIVCRFVERQATIVTRRVSSSTQHLHLNMTEVSKMIDSKSVAQTGTVLWVDKPCIFKFHIHDRLLTDTGLLRMLEHSFSRLFVPWNIRSLDVCSLELHSRDRSFPGTFVPENE